MSTSRRAAGRRSSARITSRGGRASTRRRTRAEWGAYGFTHYTVGRLGCKDGDGSIYVVDEHAEKLWLPQRHVAGIREMLRRHRVPVEGSWLRVEGQKARGLELRDLKRFVAGAHAFSRQSDKTTIATTRGLVRMGMMGSMGRMGGRGGIGGER